MSPPATPRARLAAVLIATLLCAGLARPAAAPAAEGELRWALHVTLAAKWLDPAETEAFNTPYMVLYAVHDALVRPMPAGLMTPSLAESWSESKDHLVYTFNLRKNARFHNGDPVTAEDVKYSFEQYADPKNRRSVFARGISKIEIRNANTVDLITSEPVSWKNDPKLHQDYEAKRQLIHDAVMAGK